MTTEMTTVKYGYSSRGIDGRTHDESEKTFANAYQAENWAWDFVRPGGDVRGEIEVDIEEFDERITHSIQASWRNALDPEPYTVYVWAEWEVSK